MAQPAVLGVTFGGRRRFFTRSPAGRIPDGGYDRRVGRRTLVCLVLLAACFDEGEGDGSGADPTTTATTGEATTGVDATATSGTPMDTGSSGDTMAVDSTGAPAPFCGDGNIDDGEACDDANDDVITDGCHQCMVSGTVVWESFAGNAGDGDFVVQVATDSTGNVYAVGAIGNGTGSEAWVRKLAPDGTVEWTRNPFPSNAPGPDILGGVHVVADDLIVAWQELVPGEDLNSVIVAYDDSGAVAFQHDYDNEVLVGGANGALDVLGDGSGNFITVGYRFSAFFDADAVVQLHDSAGVPTGAEYVAGDAMGEAFSAAWRIASRDGRIRASLFLNDRVEVAAWDAGFGDGTPTWSTPIVGTVASGLQFEVYEPIPIAIEADGASVVCTNVDVGGQQDIQIARLEVDGDPLSNDTFGNPATADTCGSIAVAANGDILVAWTAAVDDANASFTVTRMTSNAQVVWETALEGGAAGFAQGIAIAQDPEGWVIVGGAQFEQAGDRQSYVAKLVP